MMENKVPELRIPVTVAGVEFKNPFYVASGPTTKSVRQLVEIERTGWAAASIKLSIDPAPYINRKPRYSLFKDRHALAFTAEKRLTFEQGLQLIRDAKPLLHDLKLMANITYAGDNGTAGWVNMAKKFEEAGADIIELNMCCPNMSYNLEMTSGGSQHAAKQTGASMGQHAEIAAEIVRAIKKELRIPLFVKLTPEGGQIAQVAKALYEAGADAVGGTGNRLGMPPINLDNPGAAAFHLQDELSMGCYCSSWLKPLAQRDTYEIRKVCGLEPPIMAAGGITNWRDAVEMVLCGGTLLGVCAETLISGYDIVRPMIAGLYDYMQKHGYTDLSQMRGLIVPEVKTATDVTLYAGYAHIKDPNLSAPCKSACPHHVPVQAYVQKIAKGDYRRAWELLTNTNALQNLCALVCEHPCEDACVRGGVDAPVKIRELKRFVLEYGKAQGWKPAWSEAEPNGHRVAVIGAGPAGLTCAAELKRAGYAVTVFEKEKEAGGLLRYAMPDYAGHRAELQATVDELKQAGVEFRFETALTAAPEGYDAAFAAAGAWEKQTSAISGAEKALDAREFLLRLNTGKTYAFTGSVAVIGNGWPAIDAARAAIRLGADEVTILAPSAFPARSAYREALALAREEGVSVLENVQTTAIGKNCVEFSVNGAKMTISVSAVLLENSYIAQEFANTVKPGRITNVISAISAGKNAAAQIDRQLRGEAATLQPIAPVKTVNPEKVRSRSGYLKKEPNPVRLNAPAAERKSGFAPCARVMTEAEAQKEASRCLNCGCGEGCQLCKTICTDFAPYIAADDTMQICKGDCVACGMCYNRCPNGNIEMVNLGEKV